MSGIEPESLDPQTNILTFELHPPFFFYTSYENRTHITASKTQCPTIRRKRLLLIILWGRDSNPRPLDHESNELPLLHPTLLIYLN